MTPVVVALLAVSACLLCWPPELPLLPLGSARLPRPGAARRRRAAEREWLDALVAELSAGRDPSVALLAVERAGGDVSVCPNAVVAVRAGADVVPGLHRDGERSETVRAAAACWDVASSTGAGLAASLAVLADSVRESERVRDELAAGLAEPRATAVVLACLPTLGLVLGSMLGAQPLAWLTGSTLGRAVLAVGLVLEVLGCVWSWRIARGLEAAL